MVFLLREVMATCLVQKLGKSRLHTVIWTVRFAFLLIGIISTVVLLKVAIPYLFNLILSDLPTLWSFFRSLLSPPYLYVLVNFIIISILASSSFQQKHSEMKNEEPEGGTISLQQQQQKRTDFEVSSREKLSSDIWSEMDTISDEYPPDSGGNPSESDLTVVQKSAHSSPAETWFDICVTDSIEKPPASVHLSVGKSVNQEKLQRKSFQPSRLEDHDTLDETWRGITERHSMSKHLTKSETWNTPPRVEVQPIVSPPAVSARRELRKSETFNDASSTVSTATTASSASSRGSGGLSREILMSHDELNRRVEAFIKKFNDEIRLERQESYKHYMEMVNRGYY